MSEYGNWGSEWPPEVYYRMIRQRGQGSGGSSAYSPLVLSPDVYAEASLATLFTDITHLVAASAHNDPIGAWLNEGTLGGYFLASSNDRRPALQVNGSLLSVKGLVIGDATPDVLSLLTPIIGTGFYCALAIRTPASPTNFERFATLTTDSEDDFQPNNTILLARDALTDNFSVFGVVAPSLEADTPYVIEIILTGGNCDVTINGIAAGSAATAVVLAENNFRLFARKDDGTDGSGVNIAAVFANVGAAPSVPERAELIAYLGTLVGA